MTFPIHALCWTLVHSLWEGLLAAVAAGTVLVCTRQSSAALRYRLLTFVFFGLVACVGFTFLRELPREGVSTAIITVTGTPVSIVSAGPAQLSVTPTAPPGAPALWPAALLLRVGAFCDAHALLIVSAWLLILLGKLAQTGWSLIYVRRIRREKVRPAPSDWSDRLRTLADALGLRRPITLLESGLIRVPMVIGYLKPVILVPMGILAQLPQDQLEAVLLHELAHIRRRDYLVNLLQGLVEALLFFNPAIWWISSLIREERENCCDDIAIRATRSKAQLIHALVAFQEYSLAAPAYAVAFPGRRNHLLNRVKRIVYNRNKTLSAMEKFLLTGCLIVAACLTLAFSPLGHRLSDHRTMLTVGDTLPPIPPVAPVAPTPAIATPIAPAPPVAVPIAPISPKAMSDTLHPVAPISPIAPIAPLALPDDFQGGSFQGHLDIDDGTVTFVRGVWSNGDMRKYFMDNKKVVQENGVTTALFIDGQKVPEDELNQHQSEIQQMIATLNEEAHRGARMSVDRNTSGGATMSADRVYIRSGSGSVGSGNVSASGFHESTGTGVSSSTEVSTGTSGNTQTEDLMHPVLQDVLSQHLVSDTTNMSFSLDDKRMLVNDVKQPAEIFESFHKKYIVGKKDAYKYARNGDNVTSSVTQNRGN